MCRVAAILRRLTMERLGGRALATANFEVQGREHGFDRADANDFVLALASGPNAWTTPDSASTPMVRAGFVSALIGAAATGGVLSALILTSRAGEPIMAQIGLVAVAAVAMLMMSSSSIASIRRQQNRGGRRSVLALRVLSLVTFAAIWIGNVPILLSPLICVFGLFIGIEAALTASLIGHERRLGELLANFALSPVHLGAVCGAIAIGLIGADESVNRMVFTAVLSLEVAAASSIATFELYRRLLVREAVDRHEIQIRERTAQAHRRAHWIHDDVCADIRAIRVTMATKQLDQAAISSELDKLDDRLRERQLDEMVHGGNVAAAEILQSSVRRAQNAGITILAVPHFEEASILLDAEPARLLRRCTAGFVANALNAGATELSFVLMRTADDVIVTVTDNAGGFDLGDAPAGRGLASLARDLGPGRLMSERTHDGTAIAARISLTVDPLAQHSSTNFAAAPPNG